MKWKLTEIKFKRLRKLWLTICAFGLIVYAYLIKYAMKANPQAFIHLAGEINKISQLETIMWYFVIFGWIVVIILYYRDIKQSKGKHWLSKLWKDMEQKNNEDEKNEIFK